MNKKYPIICFEGVDGAGKTTLSKRLAEMFQGVCLKSPPDEIAATRHFIKHAGPDITFHHYVFGNAAAGLQAQKLAATQLVCLDRYHFSTRAYHYEVLEKGALMPELPEVDLIIFLHAGWEIIEKRLSERSDRKPHENIENLKKVYQNYQRVFSQKKNVITIDTGKYSIDESIAIIIKNLS